jgi:hypothetical protein
MMNGFFHRTLIALCIIAEVTSFLYTPQVHPNLKSIANAQLGHLLQIRLDIGKKASEQRIALQGPVIKLLDIVTKAIPLPGASGPNPQISSGSKSIEIVKEGFVIDMNGSRTIPFQDGCWEMIWKEGALDGTMVCGFKLPEVRRTLKSSLFAPYFLCSTFLSNNIFFFCYSTDQAKRSLLSCLSRIHELSRLDEGKLNRGSGIQTTSRGDSPCI